MKKNAAKKNIFAKLLLSLAVGLLILPSICGATNGAPPPANPDPPAGSNTATGGSGTAPTSQDAPVTANELLYQFNYKDPADSTKSASPEQMAGTKIGAVNALPNTTWTKALAEIVKILLNISGALALLAFTVGGAMMVFSSGNGDLLEKGKKITVYAIEGLVIIAVSYALVIGVSELQIFPDSGDATPAAGGSGQPAPATPPAGSNNTTGGAAGQAPK
jgi:hypothetical protein